MTRLREIQVTAPVLALLCAVFVVLADNHYFWGSFFKSVEVTTWGGFSFGLGVFVILTGIFSVIFLLLSARPVFKPILIATLLLSALVSYFQMQYSVIIDKSMIQNVVETDTKEAIELVSFSLLFHMAMFGILPALAVGFVRVRYRPFLREAAIRILAIAGAVLVAAFFVWLNYKDFVIIGRAHRELRMFINPTAPLFEAYKFTRNKLLTRKEGPIKQIGLDAKQGGRYLQAVRNGAKKTVVVLVVGETARAKSFSLNGYERETNPELGRDDVISFRNAFSCGTSTAESVPCIFSHFDRVDYSSSTQGQYENVLDVLARAGVKVLWRDNNSGCKGVCTRIPYENETTLARKEQCSEGECFDELLLNQLRERIEQTRSDLLIVLHQKGSHGPACINAIQQGLRAFRRNARTMRHRTVRRSPCAIPTTTPSCIQTTCCISPSRR